MLAGVVVAVVLRNPMYLVLSGVGGLVALATRLVGQRRIIVVTVVVRPSAVKR